MDIAEFLKSRLDEEEKEAHNVCAVQSTDAGVTVSSRDTWFAFPGDPQVYSGAPGDHGEQRIALGYDHHVAWYIASHNPARVLAEIAAKRRTLARHSRCGSGVGYCDDGGHGIEPGEGPGRCNDLLDLAAPYAGHPDYDPAWAIDSTP